MVTYVADKYCAAYLTKTKRGKWEIYFRRTFIFLQVDASNFYVTGVEYETFYYLASFSRSLIVRTTLVSLSIAILALDMWIKEK
jgi:hypothetical protein